MASSTRIPRREELVVSNKPFIQILHTGALHWICVGNTKNHNNSCNVYDSLSSGNITPSVACQIALFCHTADPEIRVEICSIQQQKNYVDCGLYAIAFATTLALGCDPTKVVYDRERLRPMYYVFASRKNDSFS